MRQQAVDLKHEGFQLEFDLILCRFDSFSFRESHPSGIQMNPSREEGIQGSERREEERRRAKRRESKESGKTWRPISFIHTEVTSVPHHGMMIDGISQRIILSIHPRYCSYIVNSDKRNHHHRASDGIYLYVQK